MQCTECNRIFSLKSNLTRHLRMVHGLEVERFDIQPGGFDEYHYKCLEGCNISFKYNRELRKHLTNNHAFNMVELDLEFPNLQEFKKWLNNEETNSYVQYVHLTATKRKTTGTETDYYECSRTGKFRYVDDTARKRRARKLVTKLNRGCTSQIIVNKTHDGCLSVNYFKTHYGHEIDLDHLKLSKQDRGAIASKLILGLPVSSVLHSAKNTTGDQLKRINLLVRKDVVNIRKSFNIGMKEGKVNSLDIINVNNFLTECNEFHYNPVLYCSIQDGNTNELCFILMTEYQSQILRESCDFIAINSTTLNNCDFELVTLFIIWKSGESFPAVCMFTNSVSKNTYNLFFEKIRDRIGIITPNVLITDCDKMYHEIWSDVMGEVPCYFNPVQVAINWKINLNRIICSETEVTKIKRKWVYDSLKYLQNNNDENDFLENLEATMKVLNSDQDFSDFLQYFSNIYHDSKRWASCYKPGELPSEQFEVINDVLRQYLNEDTETRFDLIFHSLIRFIRDETVNSMLKNKTNRAFFMSENDTRHALLMQRSLSGTHISDNIWNVTENETTHIVQKYLEKKCCTLTCTTCSICIHCFSCSCVDFFVSNAICVHVHYIWVTYFQSIVQSSETGDEMTQEEIIIEIQEDQDDVDTLRNAIMEQTAVLNSNIYNVQDCRTLRVVLDNVKHLCDMTNGQEKEGVLTDHTYL